jgi:two-component system, OmpR family, response regulator
MQTESPSAPRVLVVDDDFTIRTEIASYLSGFNLQVRSIAGLDGLANRFLGREIDLVVLGVAQDYEKGLGALREIRSWSGVPIIVACRYWGESWSVAALDLGADHYLIHPLAMRELVARIRAVLRREKMTRQVDHVRAKQGYRFGGWQLDRRNRVLANPNGKQVPLTKREYALLLALVEAGQQPLTRAQLLDATRIHDDVFDRSVDVQISRLRRKLEINPRAPRIIRTERGFGYFFTLPVESF